MGILLTSKLNMPRCLLDFLCLSIDLYMFLINKHVCFFLIWFLFVCFTYNVLFAWMVNFCFCFEFWCRFVSLFHIYWGMQQYIYSERERDSFCFCFCIFIFLQTSWLSSDKLPMNSSCVLEFMKVWLNHSTIHIFSWAELMKR